MSITQSNITLLDIKTKKETLAQGPIKDPEMSYYDGFSDITSGIVSV